MTKKRLTFRCWNCGKVYGMTREIDGQPTIIVACPDCEKEAVVDLDPYRKKVTAILKGAQEAAHDAYDFPDIIPTTQPQD